MALLLQRCHYIRHAYRSGATLRCACLYSATLSDMHDWVQLFRYPCSLSASPSGMKSCMLQIHQTRLYVRCGSHGFVKLISYHPGRHLEYIKFLVDALAVSLGCYKDDVCNSGISKISILHANPWSFPVSGKIFLYFCNKLPFWRPF